MSTIPAPPPDASLQARLRTTTRVVRVLILLGAARLIVHTLWTWSVPEHALAQMREATSVCKVDHITLQSQVLGALWTLLPVGVLLVALQRLWDLFGEYGRGHVFSHRALLSLRSFARCVLATAFISPLYGGVLSVIATWVNGPGRRELNVSLSSDDYVMLLLGAVLLAISGVMAEAARVAEDNAGFV